MNMRQSKLVLTVLIDLNNAAIELLLEVSTH